MIITKLIGGLGNQMFQYAAAKALAIEKNTTLKLDTRAFQEEDTLRYYKLNCFKISESIITEDEVRLGKPKHSNKLLNYLDAKCQALKPYYKRYYYKDPHFHYDTNFLKADSNVYLDGYWQTEKYFKSIAPVIIENFTVANELEGKNKEMANLISATQSVSIHVRRGDYIDNEITNEVHGVCDMAYYTRAIERISHEVENPHFFIFSDDLDWVSDNFKIAAPVELVGQNDEKTDYEDMRLMSLCKHNIIANSSFSWWGAWLNLYHEKMVIAPQEWFDKDSRWFKEEKVQIHDLIPEDWLRI